MLPLASCPAPLTRGHCLIKLTILPRIYSTLSLHLQELRQALISRLYQPVSQNTSPARPYEVPSNPQLTSQPAPEGRLEVQPGSQGCAICRCCHLLDSLLWALQLESPSSSTSSLGPAMHHGQVHLLVIYTVVPRTPSIT